MKHISIKKLFIIFTITFILIYSLSRLLTYNSFYSEHKKQIQLTNLIAFPLNKCEGEYSQIVRDCYEERDNYILLLESDEYKILKVKQILNDQKLLLSVDDMMEYSALLSDFSALNGIFFRTLNVNLLNASKSHSTMTIRYDFRYKDNNNIRDSFLWGLALSLLYILYRFTFYRYIVELKNAYEALKINTTKKSIT